MEIGRRMFLRSLVGVVGTGLVTKSFGEALLPLAEKALGIPTVLVDSTGEKSKYLTISQGMAALSPKTGGLIRLIPGVYGNDTVNLPNNVRIVGGGVTITGCYFTTREGRKDPILELESGNIGIFNCCFIGEGGDTPALSFHETT